MQKNETKIVRRYSAQRLHQDRNIIYDKSKDRDQIYWKQ